MIEIYHKPWLPEHVAHVDMFWRIVERFSLTPFQPNPEKAPWHVQAKLHGHYETIVNFWPHTGKAQVDGEKSVYGEEAITASIAEALSDEEFEVIE